MNILLISGHGAGDAGAAANIDGTLYKEAEETRRVTAALQPLLTQYADVDIYPTDRNAFSDSCNGALTSVMNIPSYDYVLEVHFNAFQAQSADWQTKGVECYVPTAETGTTVENLICEKVADVGLKNRGVKRYNWSVIYNVKTRGVSAALLEVCFIDDPDDMRVYLQNFDDIVSAIAAGIVEGFGLGSFKMDFAEEETEDDDMTIYEKLEDVPDWGQATVNKLLTKKYLVGEENALNLEKNMLRVLVINDRAGLYD